MKKTIKGDQNIVAEVKKFIETTNGLTIVDSMLSDYLVIEQKLDSKRITLNTFDFEEVLFRTDETNKPFLQINFASGKKILMTETLIGFRPMGLFGLDMEKLPKVVTTPDIQSVFDAIQESLQSTEDEEGELEVLRKVYDAVVCGGESVGFDLKDERKLLACIPTKVRQASA